MMKETNKRSLGRPRESEKDRPTNQVILEAASRLFLNNGYTEVSIDDVARACNVTKATVYYYYENKAVLFTETIVQMINRISSHTATMMKEDIPLRSRLFNVTKAHLKATVDIDIDSFMRGTKNVLSANQIHQIRDAEENLYKVIEGALIAAMNRGEIDKVNPHFAAHAYVSLLKVGNYRDAEHQPIFSTVEESAEEIVNFFWRGVSQGPLK